MDDKKSNFDLVNDLKTQYTERSQKQKEIGRMLWSESEKFYHYLMSQKFTDEQNVYLFGCKWSDNKSLFIEKCQELKIGVHHILRVFCSPFIHYTFRYCYYSRYLIANAIICGDSKCSCEFEEERTIFDCCVDDVYEEEILKLCFEVAGREQKIKRKYKFEF